MREATRVAVNHSSYSTRTPEQSVSLALTTRTLCLHQPSQPLPQPTRRPVLQPAHFVSLPAMVLPRALVYPAGFLALCAATYAAGISFVHPLYIDHWLKHEAYHVQKQMVMTRLFRSCISCREEQLHLTPSPAQLVREAKVLIPEAKQDVQTLALTVDLMQHRLERDQRVHHVLTHIPAADKCDEMLESAAGLVQPPHPPSLKDALAAHHASMDEDSAPSAALTDWRPVPTLPCPGTHLTPIVTPQHQHVDALHADAPMAQATAVKA